MTTHSVAGPRRRRVRTALGVGLVAVGLLTANAQPVAAGELRNVAAGRPYTATAQFPDDQLRDVEQRAYPDSGGELTDNRLAEGTDFTNAAWVGYLQQVSRSVVIDLGGQKTIQQLSADYLFHPTAAVNLPGKVRYSLSLDGKKWRVAGEVAGNNRGVVNEHRTVALTIPKTFAKYVKVTFDVNGWGFVDEIVATGTDGVANGAQPPRGPVEEPADTADKGYLPQGTPEVGGVKNMYLAYTYNTSSPNGELGKWRPEQLLPVISHVDGQGRPTDWMFDTVLFMAGGSEADAYPTKAGWDDLLDRLFAPGLDVDALDQATGTAREALADPDHRVKLVLPIPNPVPDAAAPWGTVNGETLDLNPSRVGNDASTANRLKVVRWFVDEATRRYQQAGHTRLDFMGFYWMRESLAPNSLDTDLVGQVSQDLHSADADLRFYWIPYYQSPGFQHWRSYGFDASMLQPNFFFDDSLAPGDLRRLASATKLARWSGQGLEVEGDNPMLTDAGAREKYLNYLRTFHDTGGDQAIKGYYWGARDLILQLAASADPAARATYDATYEFIRNSR